MTLAASGQEDPLSPWRWRSRLLFLFAPDGATPSLLRQRAMLEGASEGIAERDLIRVEVVGDAASDARLAGGALRRRFDVPEDRFEVILVGKDGGVKLRRAEPVSEATLFATIDAMPMRRQGGK